jgi:hypothetical protein
MLELVALAEARVGHAPAAASLPDVDGAIEPATKLAAGERR